MFAEIQESESIVSVRGRHEIVRVDPRPCRASHHYPKPIDLFRRVSSRTSRFYLLRDLSARSRPDTKGVCNRPGLDARNAWS